MKQAIFQSPTVTLKSNSNRSTSGSSDQSLDPEWKSPDGFKDSI